VLIFQITAKKPFQLNGTNPHTMTFGTEADIQTFATLGGTNRFIFEMLKQPSYTRRNVLDIVLAPLRMKGMQWPSGF
jgi:hypothetical protein